MKTGITILAGLLVGVLTAAGILAAFVLVGPDPVGLRPTPAPTLVPVSPSPVIASPSPSPSPSPSLVLPSGSPAPSAPGSADPGVAFHLGQPGPALALPQLGGGTIDLVNFRGKAVWLNVMQTTSRRRIGSPAFRHTPVVVALARRSPARLSETGVS